MASLWFVSGPFHSGRKDPACTEPIRHPAPDRDEDCEAQRVAGQNRLHTQGCHVDGGCNGRHGGVENRGVERLHEERYGHQPGQQTLAGRPRRRLGGPGTAGLTRAPRSSDLPVMWKLAPTLFVHFNAECLRSALNPLPRFVALGIGDVLHLIEPGDRIPDVRGVVEGFLLRVRESIAGFRDMAALCLCEFTHAGQEATS